MIQNIIEGFWISFFFAGISAYPVSWLLRVIKSETQVSPYAPAGHQRKQGTLIMGGLICLIGVLCGIVYFLYDFHDFKYLFVLIGGFALIGFADDYLVPKVLKKRGIGWKEKLLMQFLVVFLFAFFLYGFEIEYRLEVLFFVLLVVMFANAVNFTDGLDGLGASILIFSLIPFALYFYFINDEHSIIAVIMIGSMLPFLVFNSPPAKVFMGDVGSLFLGAMYGLLFVKSPWDSSLFPWVASFIFLIELVPVPIQIAWVKLFKKRLFPATPIHHAFEVRGVEESKIVWNFVLLQAILSALACTIVWESFR